MSYLYDRNPQVAIGQAIARPRASFWHPLLRTKGRNANSFCPPVNSIGIGHRFPSRDYPRGKGPAVPIRVLMAASAIDRPSDKTGARRGRQMRRLARETK